jgi:type I restriction enzyme M protein
VGAIDGMDGAQHTKIVNFIWGIADDVLRDLYVRGKYRDVILPMTVVGGQPIVSLRVR